MRSTERHPTVIKSALERFENSLLLREKQKKDHALEFQEQLAHNESYVEMIKKKVQDDKQK